MRRRTTRCSKRREALRSETTARNIPRLVIDALLGTGITGPATGRALEGIRKINALAADCGAKVVAVDIPSGMPSDSGEPAGEFAHADYTVTFTAPKPCHVFPPNCDHVGELAVAPIGSPASFYADAQLELVEPAMFRDLLAPRPPDGHKGTFGHALIVAGSIGKTGAAAMCGIAALARGRGVSHGGVRSGGAGADLVACARIDDGIDCESAARGAGQDGDRDGAGSGTHIRNRSDGAADAEGIHAARW